MKEKKRGRIGGFLRKLGAAGLWYKDCSFGNPWISLAKTGGRPERFRDAEKENMRGQRKEVGRRRRATFKIKMLPSYLQNILFHFLCVLVITDGAMYNYKCARYQ